MKMIDEYIELADGAMDQVFTAYSDLSKRIAEQADAQLQLIEMKNAIESKKNKMIAAGEISGKNAEERAANAWIAIPEYDDLAVLEANAAVARANADIADANLSAWGRRLEFYSQMIDVLLAKPTLADCEKFGDKENDFE